MSHYSSSILRRTVCGGDCKCASSDTKGQLLDENSINASVNCGDGTTAAIAGLHDVRG